MALTMEINKKTVTLTNLEKELWPGEGITKYDVIKYYLEISPYILPHLKDRFLVFQRFPEGIHGQGFYQKNSPQGAPSWLQTIPFHHGKKVTNYILATGPETLSWMGNQACLEIHPWLSSVETPDNPDFAVFDLDPMEGINFSQICTIAMAVKNLLDKKGLRCYAKTSGSRGIQIYLPLLPVYTYDLARVFCEDIFKQIYSTFPAFTTLERSVSNRGKKIYLDYLQNGRGKTLAAPYSLRPLPGAPVSTPLEWGEIAASTFLPSTFNIKNIFHRLNERGDLFAPVLTDRQWII